MNNNLNPIDQLLDNWKASIADVATPRPEA